MGILRYRVLRRNNFFPSAVVFARGEEKITVSMLEEVLNWCISVCALQDQHMQKFKTARICFKFIILVLHNNITSRSSVKDIKVMINILEEIANMNTTQAVRENNAYFA